MSHLFNYSIILSCLNLRSDKDNPPELKLYRLALPVLFPLFPVAGWPRLSLILFFLMGGSSLIAQRGTPFLTNYPPAIYQNDSFATSPMNWGVAQDGNGFIYVANSNQVLTFDGLNWNRVQEAGNKWFLKFATDGKGLVFTGGREDLGYIERDSMGSLTFRSLKPQLPPEAQHFTRIYNVVSTSDGIWFRDNDFLFLWNGNEFSSWKDSTNFMKIFSANDQLFAQKRSGNLYRYTQGELVEMKMPEALTTITIKGLMVTGGTETQPDLLIATYEQGLMTLQSNTLSQVDAPPLRIWNTCLTPEGKMILATAQQGVWIVNPAGTVEKVIDETSGLQYKSTKFPFIDRDKNLWVALESGVSSIAYSLPVSHFGKKAGLDAIPTSLQVLDNVLYVGTLEGCYRLESTAQPGREALARIPGIEGQVWSLSPWEGGLIGTANQGIFWLKGDKLTWLSDEVPNSLLPSRRDTHRLFVSTPGKIASYQFDNGVLKLEGSFPTEAHDGNYLVETPEGILWWSQFGISYVDAKNGINSSLSVHVLDSTHGYVSAMEEVEVQWLNGAVHFSTDLGLFQWDGKGQLVPDASLGDPTRPLYYAKETPEAIWAFDGLSPGKLVRMANGEWTWETRAFAHLQEKDTWCIFPQQNGELWIGTTSQLLHYDPSREQVEAPEYPALINRIRVNDSLGLSPLQSYRLPFARNNFEFNFSAPWFLAPEKTVFRFQLEGRDGDWSDWGIRNQKEYTDLKEGNYTFRVQAKNALGKESLPAAFSFSIMPPWYRTGWAWALWVVLIVGFVVLLILANTFRIRRQQSQLREAELAREKALRQTAVEAQEKERKRIAADLHDDVQATLSLAKMQTSILSRKLAKVDPDFRSPQDPVVILGEAIKSIRRISHDLMPASLERKGLTSALSEFCNKANSELLKVTFTSEGEPPLLEKSVEIGLFRIVQELFTNTLKHAGAQSVTLTLARKPEAVHLIYKDDGKGLDLLALEAQGGGLGMKNMFGRTELIGGTLNLKTSPGAGFQAHISLPLPNSNHG